MASVDQKHRHGVMTCARRLTSDQLSPVLAYRRLVAADARLAPSFLFESVEQGGQVGRFSLLGSRPMLEVIARGNEVTIRRPDAAEVRRTVTNPLDVLRDLTPTGPQVRRGPVPSCFHGGWVGHCGFDAVRWLEPGKLPFTSAPRDDRGLPDLHMGLYGEVVVFDHVTKSMIVCASAPCHGDARDGSLQAALEADIDRMVATLEADTVRLQPGRIDDDAMGQPQRPVSSSTPPGAFRNAVERAKAYIRAGDAFQVVLSQRFERTTATDPFDLYRMLRVVNPSPYQAYLQGEGCILVASSPEILCRVREGTVTNRPLAGTRRRGRDEAEDARLERELLADAKERAEHVMLVDLGRNDLGRVSELGSVQVKACMDVERYSHVMHISSTLEGSLRPGLDAWDALHAALPVGTVSGAPKVRAIQIIDELEPVRRGPYSGGLGCVGWNGDLDIALALRTMVIPTALHDPTRGTWRVDLQAGAGIVLDSDPAAEEDETINKAAALGRAIELAERSFGP
ncbi:MAG: hypothetical protein RLZZ217_1762 [Planctomycetota bacterium]